MPHRPERILLLTPTSADAELSRRVLGEAGIACDVCPAIEDLLRELEAGAGALLLTDEALVPEVADRLFAAVESQPAWSDLPIVLLSGVNAETVVTFAWDISWYQYRVAPESGQPVRLEERGHDLDEIDPAFAVWNARLDQADRLVPDIERL